MYLMYMYISNLLKGIYLSFPLSFLLCNIGKVYRNEMQNVTLRR